MPYGRTRVDVEIVYSGGVSDVILHNNKLISCLPAKKNCFEHYWQNEVDTISEPIRPFSENPVSGGACSYRDVAELFIYLQP